ncbi:MAG: type III pantothenate kinase [Synechococcaceae bacterium WBB_10_009]|jgi:type III pantothenate kinase|nr:type III pantothenate kinase [Synechococcaceae bacterium WBB_10_009]
MAQLLLVGNSRWHWAEAAAEGWRCWHGPPPTPGQPPAWDQLRAWAAVGPLPAGCAPPPQCAIGLGQVPLADLPPWLGIDRALVGWGAWHAEGAAALVADAGTALSLTWVDGDGRFRGGRISAGAALQRRSLAQATALLPAPQAPAAPMDWAAADPWPLDTETALQQGCWRATAAAIALGWRELSRLDPDPRRRLWLTGGDGEALAPLLEAEGLAPQWAPDLALQALAALPAVGLLS